MDAAAGKVRVWITDRGRGIAEGHLHRATHGFWLIPHSVDRLWLLTGTGGTTLVMEQERERLDRDRQMLGMT